MSTPELFVNDDEEFFHTFRGVTAAWSEEVKLDLEIPAQQQINWCWAAASVGVADSYGDQLSGVSAADRQCTLATSVLAIPCCPPGSNPAGNQPIELDRALGANLDKVVPQDSLKTPAFVRDNIRKGRPIAVRLRSNISFGGHVVVIYGYRRIGSTFTLHVQDPHGAIVSEEPFEEFVNNRQQSMSWDISYTTRGVNRSRVPAQ